MVKKYAKKRWVKKSAKKAKGWKKTGRTRQPERMVRLPKNAGYKIVSTGKRYPLPSELDIMLETVLEFTVPVTAMLGGASALATLCCNSIYNPFGTALSNYSGSAIVTATTPGLIGTLNTENLISATAPYVSQLSILYSKYCVLGAQLSVEMNPLNGNDVIESVIYPAYDLAINQTNMYRNALTYKNAHQSEHSLFKSGISKNSNINKGKWIRMQDLVGQPELTDGEYLAESGGSGIIAVNNAPLAAGRLGMVFVCKDTSNSNLVSAIPTKFILRQKVRFCDAYSQQVATV